MHMCETQKNGIADFICKAEQGYRCIAQMYGYEGGKEGGWEELGDWDQACMLLTLCIKQVTNENLHGTGNSIQYSVAT